MVVNYLMVGCIFIFLIDVMCTLFRNNKAFKDIPAWGWKERTACALLWPIAMVIFLKAYFKSIFKL